MSKILKIVGGVVVIIILLVILVLGYFGFVPGVSALLGAHNPVDLGVQVTEADHESFLEKSGISYEIDNSGEKWVATYSGTQRVNESFTDSEISSALRDREMQTFPIEQSTIKFNDDDTVEFSAVINKQDAIEWIKQIPVEQDVIDQLKPYIGFLPSKVAVYWKGEAEMHNNEITSAHVYALKVGRFSVPTDIVNDNAEWVHSRAEQRISEVPSLDVKSATISNGEFNINGTIPTLESISQ